MSPEPYNPNAPLSEKLKRYSKLGVSLFSTGAALVVWLQSEPHAFEEILGAAVAFATANYGVWRVPNAQG